MNTPLYYFAHRSYRNLTGLSKEEEMEAPDLKRRVVKTDDVKPSGDDVSPDKAGEDALKGAMKGSDDVKANGETKKKKEEKPKNKEEAVKQLSNKLAEGEISLEDAISAVRSF